MTLNEYIEVLKCFSAETGTGDLPVCIGDEMNDHFWNEVSSTYTPEVMGADYAAPDSTRFNWKRGKFVALNP